MRAWVVALLCGCGRISFDPLGGGGSIGPDDSGLPGGDATTNGDGGPDGSTALACTSPGDGTAFTGGGFCGTNWSPMVLNTGLSVSGGMLQVSPNANSTGATGECYRRSTLTPSGVFMQVIQAIPSATGKTFLVVNGGGVQVFEIYAVGSTLYTTELTGVPTTRPFDPVAAQWWRMRPVNGHVWFEASADAMTWTKLDESTAAAPTTVTIEAGAATGGSEPTPGVAKLGSIDICPP